MSDLLLLDVMDTLVYDPFNEEIPGFFGMPLEELWAVKHPDSWVRFEHGELSESEYLDSFFADGRSFDHAALMALVERSYRYLEGIEQLLGDLHERGVPMHAMSNYPSWYRLIEGRLALSRFVEWSFVSCNTGVRKPKPEAYLGAARTLGVAVEACIFVDDREKNVRAARDVGMRGIVFESAAQLRDELALR